MLFNLLFAIYYLLFVIFYLMEVSSVMKHTIYLGRDGNPDDTPASVWIIIEDDKLHIEVECYKEAWCDLDEANTQKFLTTMGINNKETVEIEKILKQYFIQSSDFKNFDILNKFKSICDTNNIQYNYNAWSSSYDR